MFEFAEIFTEFYDFNYKRTFSMKLKAFIFLKIIVRKIIYWLLLLYYYVITVIIVINSVAQRGGVGRV
jgi:hypothetical protein